ncbi:MAG: copper resistance CopC family protein [Pseudomonadota bacterium]
MIARLAVLGLMLLAAPAFAHSKKEGTSPADGAVLSTPPDVISMAFDKPITITRFRLESADGTEPPFTAPEGLKAGTDYTVTPATLAPGTYTVEWRGISDDGHPVDGSFAFTVE